jgi:hypothetical protein
MRFLTAVAIASVLTLILAVGSVAACSFAPATLDQVAAEAELIYVARVTDKPADRTYVLDVQEVFRGDVPATVTFEPDPSAGVSSCEPASRWEQRTCSEATTWRARSGSAISGCGLTGSSSSAC